MAEYVLLARRTLVGDDLKAIENAAVAVQDGKIVLIGDRMQVQEKHPGFKVLDLGGKTLMPGLIDSHTHTSLDARVHGHLDMMNDPIPDLTIRAANNMRDDLLSGITTVRILGDKGYVDASIRSAIASGALIGPRLLIAGIGMRSLHGHGFVGVPHTGELEFRKTCRENLLRRVDWLKVFVTGGAPPADGSSHIPSYVSLEEIEVVTDEAKRAGVRTSAHCIGGLGLVNCVKAGIDVIDHAYCATQDDLELVAKQNRWICLTPSVFMDAERNEHNTPTVKKNIEKGRDKVLASMRMIVESGVKYAIGSDALHGNLPLEAEFAVQLGASRYDALLGITVRGARLCGVSEKTGSLSVGKSADIIAVDGNPLEDLGCLREPALVMQEGAIFKASFGPCAASA